MQKAKKIRELIKELDNMKILLWELLKYIEREEIKESLKDEE